MSTMVKKLLKDAFEKAKNEGASQSANGLATHIYNCLEGSVPQPTTADSIRGYYRRLENEEDFNISQIAKDHLAIFLGFDNFRAYVIDQKRSPIQKRRYQVAIIFLLVVVGYFIYENNRKKCMIWNDFQYVKIHCDEPNAKPINIGLLKNFKKVTADCKIDFFFNEDGSARIWYHKIAKDHLELFTSPGLHPIYDKTLNDITPYMIKVHVCDSLE